MDKIYTAIELEASVLTALVKDAEADEKTFLRMLESTKARYQGLGFFAQFFSRERCKCEIEHITFLLGFVAEKKSRLADKIAGIGAPMPTAFGSADLDMQDRYGRQ